MSAEILIYGLIAAGLVFWLRSILGTRHGDERQRPNPFTSQKELDVSDKRTDPSSSVIPLAPQEQSVESLLPRFVSVLEMAKPGFDDIKKIDKTFELSHFVQGAESAFVIIVEAFSKADRDALKPLLSESVYAAFEGVITQREKDGQSVETEIHAIRKMEIQDATLSGNQADVTIRFVADETCVIRDKEGEVIVGDPERITEMNDIWVFSRDVKSNDPIWRLTQTRDGEPEDHKTPIPDAS